MKYKVNATFIKEKKKEFLEKLTNGEIENQKPDGQEILKSMKRAIINSDKTIEWYELCYCEKPLDHERKTVYDSYFTKMSIIEVPAILNLKGSLFWDYLLAE